MGYANTYDYPIYCDPMRIRDEQFLGQWDTLNGCWKRESILDYEKYEKELQDVIVQVKEGNYSKAKECLLTYYRNKFQNYDINISNEMNEENDEICCQALERNVYSSVCMNGVPVGFLDMDTTCKWRSIDILIPLTRMFLGNVKYAAYQFMSVDKTDNKAHIYSRKSQYVPYLELVLNGETVKVDCAKDTMVSAGGNADKNFSNREIYDVREHGIYHNHDDRMNRAYFAFDISFIKATDEITSATLNIYGSCEQGEKEIYVYNELASNWEEESFCWNHVTDELLFSCNDMPSWDYITCSFPDIKGKICFYHRGAELASPARRYLATGDEKYAYTHIRNMMAIIHFVGCSREVFNELDMGRYCDDQSLNLVRVINSAYMTGEYFCACLKNLYANAKWLVDNFYGRMGNNWASFGTLGVYAVYGFFPELKAYDEWAQKTCLENERLMEHFANPDGSCVELGTHYQEVLIRTVISPVRRHLVNGTTLPYSEKSFDILKSLIKSYYYTLSPTYSDYNVGDTTWPFDDLRRVIRNWYHVLPGMFEEDGELLYVVSDGKRGKLPDFTTMRFPDNKRVYMKSDWGKEALAMTVTGKVLGSHGHKDVYSLAMMAYGRHLLTDQGYGTLLTGPIFAEMISSANHNVLLADQCENLIRPQNNDPKEAQYLKDAGERAFYTDAQYDFYELTGANNPGVAKQNRSVLFCKAHKFWIVTDYIKPVNCEKETRYDLYWHMLPDAAMSLEAGGRIVRSNYEDGINVQVATAECLDDGRIMNAKYSPGEGMVTDSKKACLVRNKRGQVTYTSVIVPSNRGESFDVKCEALDGGSPDINACRIEITDHNGTKRVFFYGHNNEDEGTYCVGKFTSDAMVMLVRINDKGEKVEEFCFKND